MIVFILLLAALAGYLGLVGFVSRRCPPAERTAKLTGPLSMLINFAPLIAGIVFGVLFLFVFEGQLWERISHAVMVFTLWLYAVQFYQYAFCYIHKKKLLLASAAGMVFAGTLAVLLTPLHRYIEWYYAYQGKGALFSGCRLLAWFYVVKALRYWKWRAGRTGG